MIKQVSRLPDLTPLSVENFKILSDCEIYPDLTEIYLSDKGTIISHSPGGGCVISGEEDDEIVSFLEFLNPQSIFCSFENASKINLKGYEKMPVFVMKTVAAEKGGVKETDVKSDEVYSLLKEAEDFYLPSFENFAVDFCRRKNRGSLVVRCIDNTALSMAFTLSDTAFICGVVSKRAGYGSKVLKELLSLLYGKTVFAAVREQIVPFYLKNGFKTETKATYFIKK